MNSNNNYNLLDGYAILNSVKPKEKKTKFPYSPMEQHDIVFTKNKIEILAKKIDTFVSSRENTKNSFKGGNNKVITIYY